MATISGIPRTTAWVDTLRKIAREADQWLQTLVNAVNSAEIQVGSADVTAETAAVSATDLETPPLSGGLYRLSYSLRIVTPASVSSSVTPSFAWTSNSAPQTVSGAALTGNSTSTQQNATYVIDVDAGTPVSYSTAYASNAAGMAYSFNVILQVIP